MGKKNKDFDKNIDIYVERHKKLKEGMPHVSRKMAGIEVWINSDGTMEVGQHVFTKSEAIVLRNFIDQWYCRSYKNE